MGVLRLLQLTLALELSKKVVKGIVACTIRLHGNYFDACSRKVTCGQPLSLRGEIFLRFPLTVYNFCYSHSFLFIFRILSKLRYRYDLWLTIKKKRPEKRVDLMTTRSSNGFRNFFYNVTNGKVTSSKSFSLTLLCKKKSIWMTNNGFRIFCEFWMVKKLIVNVSF